MSDENLANILLSILRR